jgi:hydroxyisourate hydrolase
MGELSCHVLDTYSGKPADGMRVDLSIQIAGEWKQVASMTTSATGRPAAPLLTGQDMIAGTYRLDFHHAGYFATVAPLADPPFYDQVVHFFSILTPDDHIHITVVAAPWGYSTYRWNV